MELIYGLKDHMEQIHQELSDLRKALSVCISMQQAQPQNLMQKGLSDSYIHSGKHICFVVQFYNVLSLRKQATKLMFLLQ